jgi:methyl-accepting chemotaxis protein
MSNLQISSKDLLLMIMKKFRLSGCSTSIIVVFSGAACLSALGVLAGIGGTSLLAGSAALCSLAALTGSLVSAFSRGSRSDTPRALFSDRGAALSAAQGDEPEAIDFSAYLDGRPRGGPRAKASLEGLLSRINDDIALLQRSAVKFDLFSSDIHFSAQNLSDQAGRQLDMLVRLRDEVAEFFKAQAATIDELLRLKDRMNANAERSNELKQKAGLSKDELSALVGKSGAAAEDARSGEREVGKTELAAKDLEKGLEQLTRTALREAEEAKKIGESLFRINDIVERTHILATNASIEAARAGARGAGFGVIAQEVRKLAAASKDALEDIDAVLVSVKRGIDDSGSLVAAVSGSAGHLNEALQKTKAAFDAIGGGILEVQDGIRRFDGVFLEQMDEAARTADSAAAAAAMLEGFAEDYKRRSADYDAIVASSRESESYAREAKRSARVLAQLASYLKAGGSDRNRVLRKYRVDKNAEQKKYERKERREDLLYNLEVFDEGDRAIGHLGDLSPSGLLLMSSAEYKPGTKMPIRIALPINSEGEKRVDLTVTVRRVEKDGEGFRAGCSLDSTDAKERDLVGEILRSLSLGNMSAAAVDASTLAARAPADSAGSSAPAIYAELEDLAELEELP